MVLNQLCVPVWLLFEHYCTTLTYETKAPSYVCARHLNMSSQPLPPIQKKDFHVNKSYSIY